MKRRVLAMLVLCGLMGGTSAVYAWNPDGERSTVRDVVLWEDAGQVAFLLQSGKWCYLPNSAGNYSKTVAMLMTLYVSGKPAYFHCHDSEENIGGFSAHRFHRLAATQ